MGGFLAIRVMFFRVRTPGLSMDTTGEAAKDHMGVTATEQQGRPGAEALACRPRPLNGARAKHIPTGNHPEPQTSSKARKRRPQDRGKRSHVEAVLWLRIDCGSGETGFAVRVRSTVAKTPLWPEP